MHTPTQSDLVARARMGAVWLLWEWTSAMRAIHARRERGVGVPWPEVRRSLQRAEMAP